MLLFELESFFLSVLKIGLIEELGLVFVVAQLDFEDIAVKKIKSDFGLF